MRYVIRFLLLTGVMSVESGCVSMADHPFFVSSEPTGARVVVINSHDNAVTATAITPCVIPLQLVAGFQSQKPAKYVFEFEKNGYKRESIDVAAQSSWALGGNVRATLSPLPPPSSSSNAGEISRPDPQPVSISNQEPWGAEIHPAILPKSPYRVTALINDDPAKGDAILGNGDGFIQQGEAFDLVVVIANISTSTVRDVACTVILPADKSVNAYGELNFAISELVPNTAFTNRINLVMPMNVKLTTAPACRIETKEEGASIVEQVNYELPMGEHYP